MVFMSMRNEEAAYTLLFIVEVTRIGDYQVDAEHFFVGEH